MTLADIVSLAQTLGEETAQLGAADKADVLDELIKELDLDDCVSHWLASQFRNAVTEFRNEEAERQDLNRQLAP